MIVMYVTVETLTRIALVTALEMLLKMGAVFATLTLLTTMTHVLVVLMPALTTTIREIYLMMVLAHIPFREYRT
jgi:hypothetical protein